MITLNPYLNFNGNCLQAFEFYKHVFGGEFPYISRFGDMPPNPDYPLSEAERAKIMHISLPIGKNAVLMGCDASDYFGQVTSMGDNIHININAENVSEVDDIWIRLSEGAIITMPRQITFWGAYFGMLVDKFGIPWMINCEKPKE